LELAETLGITAVNPTQKDLAEAVSEITNGKMADCVFEVSGSAAGVEAMTDLPNVRGRIVMVAIHPQPRPVNLFKFFWSEIKMIGARLYEEQDFDEAIRLAAGGKLHLDKLITQVNPIDEVQKTFEAIDANPDGIKYLIECS
jgi:threonine dehydrogenase-like Zn-dependent dehydrogenase